MASDTISEGGARTRGSTAAMLACLAFVLAATGLFLIFPAIDLWASGLFFTPGRGFLLSTDAGLRTLRVAGNVSVAVVAVLAAGQLIGRVTGPARLVFMHPTHALFLLATLAVGPGVIVNLILKDHWGRPRPYMTEAFGGSAPYVPVWEMANFCTTNCSFVAGEASSAIWLTALALVAPRAWRRTVAVLTFAFAFLLSLNRIAFGGHFLSDVLLSWGLTLLVIAVLWRVIVETPAPSMTDARLSERLAALGRRLRGGKP